ncbi:MAG TPA: hypothetical protein VEA69_14800 [Tepidisphaeraceae bacterium]|nr:hypothetical protein [Tepidisphaeraceae bacterium]
MLATVVACQTPLTACGRPLSFRRRPASGAGTRSPVSVRATTDAGIVRNISLIRRRTSYVPSVRGSQTTWYPRPRTYSPSFSGRSGVPSVPTSHRANPYLDRPPVENPWRARLRWAWSALSASSWRNRPASWYAIVLVIDSPRSARSPRRSGLRTPLRNTTVTPARRSLFSRSTPCWASSGRARRSGRGMNTCDTDWSRATSANSASKAGRVRALPATPQSRNRSPAQADLRPPTSSVIRSGVPANRTPCRRASSAAQRTYSAGVVSCRPDESRV